MNFFMHSITYCLFINSSSDNFIYILFSPLDKIEEFATLLQISCKFISICVSLEKEFIGGEFLFFNREIIMSLSKFNLSNK